MLVGERTEQELNVPQSGADRSGEVRGTRCVVSHDHLAVGEFDNICVVGMVRRNDYVACTGYSLCNDVVEKARCSKGRCEQNQWETGGRFVCTSTCVHLQFQTREGSVGNWSKFGVLLASDRGSLGRHIRHGIRMAASNRVEGADNDLSWFGRVSEGIHTS